MDKLKREIHKQNWWNCEGRGYFALGRNRKNMNEIKNYENEKFRERRYTRPNLRANHQGNLDSLSLRQSWLRDGFFRAHESRSRGFEIGFFYFGLDRKSRNSGLQDRNMKTLRKSRKENPENPPGQDLCFRDIPGISWSGGAQETFTSDSGFFEPRDFYSRDSGFCWVSGFSSPGIGIFL